MEDTDHPLGLFSIVSIYSFCTTRLKIIISEIGDGEFLVLKLRSNQINYKEPKLIRKKYLRP